MAIERIRKGATESKALKVKLALENACVGEKIATSNRISAETSQTL
jgi:hypothetical protein